MSVDNINWQDRNKRTYLKDVLPLDTPYTIHVEPTTACNFKCIYCRHGSEKIKVNFMSLEIFDKIIFGLKKFPKKIKSFQFIGMGEPLLNKNIYNMIQKSNEISEDTVLLTNGALLTKENTDKLIKSGIKTIRISLQGISEDDYFNISNVKINFDNFLNNLEYLHKNKGSTKIYLKIPDIYINTEERKNIFYQLFEDKCDFIIVQKLSNFFSNIDYTNIVSQLNNNIKICSQIFFMMHILSDGRVSPCCSLDLNIPVIGNIMRNDLYELWNSKELKSFRILMLKNTKNNIGICKNCSCPNFNYNKYDNIDCHREELLNKYLEVKPL